MAAITSRQVRTSLNSAKLLEGVWPTLLRGIFWMVHIGVCSNVEFLLYSHYYHDSYLC